MRVESGMPTSVVSCASALYVMFDADIMAAEWVPGFYRAEPGGLSREEVLERLAWRFLGGKSCKEFRKLTFSCS